MFLVVVFVCVL